VITKVVRVLGASGGVRASGLLLIGAAGVLGGAYAYNLLCIRWLGASDYGDVAALTALGTIVLLPLLGVQAALAREVAVYRARGDEAAIGSLLRLTLRRTLIWGAAAVAVLTASAPFITDLLNISATATTIAAIVLAFSGALLPLFQGFLQGLERFRRIAFALCVYGLARPVFAIPLLLAGLGAAGALTGATLASLAATALIFGALTDLLPTRKQAVATFDLRDFRPVIFGLFAFTVLTNADVIVAKVFLDDHDAGTYASASLVGKVAALLPAAVIAPVLLPRATARLERGDDAAGIVSAALVATALFGLLLTGVLAVVPTSLVETVFGEQFADARDLLAPCAAVMTLCGLINVNLTFSFALRDRELIRLMGVALVGQAGAFALLHDGPYEILLATALGALIVIVPHEIRSPVAVWRLLRPGLRRY
jgi:O-antigen/teichoic acid export membrane protein